MKPTIRTTPTGAEVAGDLTVDSIPAFISAGYAVIDKAQSELTFDLATVAVVDSASVALLIDWVRYAKRAHKKLSFAHLPTQIEQIMTLSGLKL